MIFRSDKNAPLRRLRQINLAFLFGFGLVALSLVFWGVLRAERLAEREDNPRVVEAELRIQRGRIVDTNNVVLAENQGTPSRQERVYVVDGSEPVVGYYSLRYGTAGVEAAYDGILRGDTENLVDNALHQLFHQPQTGEDIRLTLDLALQQATVERFGDAQGAAILVALPEGVVRLVVSQPSYDANLLNEQFDQLAEDEGAPLLNRVTQGLYQPGTILTPLLVAHALNSGQMSLSAFEANSEDMIEQLEEAWSEPQLQAAWANFGLLSAPTTSLAVSEPEPVVVDDFARAIRGEEALTVSPLQLVLAYAALANDGFSVPPQFVSAVFREDRWQSLSDGTFEPVSLVSPSAATTVLPLLTAESTAIEIMTAVESGPESMNSWYVGIAPPNEPRYVTVVVLEDVADPLEAAVIGRAALNDILTR